MNEIQIMQDCAYISIKAYMTRSFPVALTRNAREELSRKALDLTVGKRYEMVTLQEVENTLAEEVSDNADMTSIIEAVSKMNTSVSILGIISLECG